MTPNEQTQIMQIEKLTPAIPAKKRIAKKKVTTKKKATRKKRAARAPVPMSAASERLAQKLAKAEGSAQLAASRVDDLRAKVKDARAKLKATGDGRAKRTIESSGDKMVALKARVATTRAAVSEAKAALKSQVRADAQAAARDAALAAAVDKFKARWLRDYDRKMRQRARKKK